MSSPLEGPALTPLQADEALAQARSDAEKLLGLDQEARNKLLKSLADLSPNISTAVGPSIDQGKAVAAASGVTIDVIASALGLAYFLNASRESMPELTTQLRTALTAETRFGSEDAEKLLSSFEPVARSFEASSRKAARIEAQLPSFRDCRVACDLRLVGGGSKATERLAPVALVRIELDEGPAVIFQCLPEALNRLSSDFGEAYAKLTLLARKAEELKE